MKKTLLLRPASPGPELTRYGVAKASAQFHSLQCTMSVSFEVMDCVIEAYQFDAAESDTPFARTLSGNISPVITQAAGPHVEAKAPT